MNECVNECMRNRKPCLAGHSASFADWEPLSAPKAHPPALLPDPLASPEGGSGHDAALRANLKMKRGGAPPDGSLAALLGPNPVQKSTGRASGGK